MVCSKCGLEVDAGAAFCGNCGQPVAAAAPAAQAAVTSPAVSSVQPPNPAPPAAPFSAPSPAPVTTPGLSVQPPSPMSPAVPSPSVVAPAPPVQPSVSVSPAAAPQPAAPASGPAYGNPTALAHPGGNKAIAALVLGVIGLIGWIIPIVGLTLGVLALIFGTMTTKTSHHKMAMAGVILGSITIFLSLCAFVYNIQAATKQQAANKASYSTAAEAVSMVSSDVVNSLTTVL